MPSLDLACLEGQDFYTPQENIQIGVTHYTPQKPAESLQAYLSKNYENQVHFTALCKLYGL